MRRSAGDTCGGGILAGHPIRRKNRMQPAHLPLVPLIAALACSALAAPPPGHPSPAQAREMLMPDKPTRAADLPNEGKVIGAMDANEFTYIEVERAGRREWIAAQKLPIKPGSTIRYEEGAVMSNFYSKLLKRSFPSVMFVNEVVVTAVPQ